MNKILNFYRCPSATVAFLDGIFLSAAINLLTGINDYSGLNKWLMLAAVALMILGTVVLFLFQNVSSNFQDGYPKWKTEREKHNVAYPEDAELFPTDWISFVEMSITFHSYFLKKEGASVDKKYKDEEKYYNNCHYGKSGLFLRIIFSVVSLIASIALMIIAMWFNGSKV